MDVNAPTCEICGKKFSRKGRSKVVKTCSLSCRRESQARRMSTLRNRSGQTDCLDADGRLPTDPSPEYIEQCCDVFRSRHLAEMRAKGGD